MPTAYAGAPMDPVAKRKEDLSQLTLMLDDQPIGPDHAVFFPFHEAPGDVRGADAIKDLSSAITMRRTHQSCQLFSGFWGSGKSTELRRLRAELVKSGHAVALVEAGRVLNLHKPLEVTDLLVSVGAGVAHALVSQAIGSPAQRTVAERFRAFFSRLAVKEIKVGGQVGMDGDPVHFLSEVSFELAKDEDFKARVQEALRGRLSTVIEEFQKFMREARASLGHKSSHPAPVLIVDDLEKVQGLGPEQDVVQKGIEHVFWRFNEALRVDGWHVVWAVPPYLQILNSKIPQQYDGSVVLPMVRLWRNDAVRTRDADGMAAMRACLQKRGPVDSLFETQALLDEILVASSGHLRDLLKLMQKATLRAYTQKDPTMPLGEAAVRSIVDEYTDGIQKGIFKQDDAWLREIGENRKLRPETALDVPRLARLLDTAVVMSYRNGDQWLDICHAAQELLKSQKD